MAKKGGAVKVKSPGNRVANRTLQLYSSSTGTGAIQSDLAHVDIPNDALAMSVQLTLQAAATADTDEFLGEISTQPVGQLRSNGARGVLAATMSRFEFTTSGATFSNDTVVISIPDGFKIADGERLYLHADCTNTKDFVLKAVVYLAEQD